MAVVTAERLRLIAGQGLLRAECLLGETVSGRIEVSALGAGQARRSYFERACRLSLSKQGNRSFLHSLFGRVN